MSYMTAVNAEPPLWRLIRDSLEAALAGGEYPAGTPLPSEAKLAARFGCAIGTVRRAAALQAHPLNVGERAVMHAQTAEAAGLRDGAMGKFSTAAGTATLPVSISDKVSPGVVWVESGYGATAPLAAARVEVKPA